jgi:hypothetical protein
MSALTFRKNYLLSPRRQCPLPSESAECLDLLRLHLEARGTRHGDGSDFTRFMRSVHPEDRDVVAQAAELGAG